MTKQNVIDLSTYREENQRSETVVPSEISEELKQAIETLIQKLRSQEPTPTES